MDRIDGNECIDTAGGNGAGAEPGETSIGETIDEDFVFDVPSVNV